MTDYKRPSAVLDDLVRELLPILTRAGEQVSVFSAVKRDHIASRSRQDSYAYEHKLDTYTICVAEALVKFTTIDSIYTLISHARDEYQRIESDDDDRRENQEE